MLFFLSLSLSLSLSHHLMPYVSRNTFLGVLTSSTSSWANYLWKPNFDPTVTETIDFPDNQFGSYVLGRERVLGLVMQEYELHMCCNVEDVAKLHPACTCLAVEGWERRAI